LFICGPHGGKKKKILSVREACAPDPETRAMDNKCQKAIFRCVGKGKSGENRDLVSRFRWGGPHERWKGGPEKKSPDCGAPGR